MCPARRNRCDACQSAHGRWRQAIARRSQTKLTGIIASPRQDGSTLRKGQTVRSSRGHSNDAGQPVDLLGRGQIVVVSRSKLSEIIFTQCPNRIIAVKEKRVIASARQT